MSLLSALSIASGGLANVNSQLAVVSHNVSNANTAGYTREIGQQSAMSGNGQGMGVRTEVTVRSIDTMMQAEAWQQNAAVAAMTVRSQALSAVDAANGTPGQGNDLASLTGGLSDAFTTLSADPSSTAGQAAVVAAAGILARGINSVAQAVGTQRQTAQDSIGQELTQLNTALTTIGTLSNQISTMTHEGTSTAALEDQRDTAMNTVAQLTGATFFNQPNGSVQVILPSGATLPTDGSASLQTTDSHLSAQTAAPAVTLNGQDMTAQFTGGQIGANLALRDTELPTFQAELDEFSNNLTQRFSKAGVDLFTDPTPPTATAPPAQAAYLGLANRIAVNPVVLSNPAKVQQGTGAVAIGASNQTVINAVLNQAFGTVSASTAAAPLVTGLGLSGTLSAPFAVPQTLASFAAIVVATQTGASSTASTALANAQAVQTNLNSKVAAVSGVSVDTEMSTMIGLQNAYSANARIITAVNDMWTTVLHMGGG